MGKVEGKVFEGKFFEGFQGLVVFPSLSAGLGATGSVFPYSSTAISWKHWLLTHLIGRAPRREAADVWILAAGWTGG